MHKARRAEKFLGTEENSSRIKVSKQNFEQNKRFLRALPAGRISHFTSRIYPSLFEAPVINMSKKCRVGLSGREETRTL